jgi:hypothetical protein
MMAALALSLPGRGERHMKKLKHDAELFKAALLAGVHYAEGRKAVELIASTIWTARPVPRRFLPVDCRRFFLECRRIVPLDRRVDDLIGASVLKSVMNAAKF